MKPKPLPRSRQKHIPSRINDGAPNHHFHTTEDYFRQQYFAFIDLLSAELSKCFNQPTFSVLQEIEEMIISSCNGDSHDLSSPSENLYNNFVDILRLKIHLSLLPDVLRTGNNDHGMGIKKVTMVSSVCELFETCLEEVHKVLLLYLTILLSSANAEQAFSTLRCLKLFQQ